MKQFVVALIVFAIGVNASSQDKKITLVYKLSDQTETIPYSNSSEPEISINAANNAKWSLESSDGIDADNITLKIIGEPGNDETYDVKGDKGKKNIDLTVPFRTLMPDFDGQGAKTVSVLINNVQHFIFEISLADNDTKSPENDVSCNLNRFTPNVSLRTNNEKKKLPLSYYTYIYDVQNQKGGFYRYKQKKNKYWYTNNIANSWIDPLNDSLSSLQKGRISPGIGKEINVLVINNTKYKSISVDQTTTNFNTEDTHGVAGFFSPGTKGDTGAKARSNVELESKLKILNRNLEEYKNYLKEYQVEDDQLESDKSFIRASIALCFSTGGFQIDSIQKSLLQIHPTDSIDISNVMYNLRYCLSYTNPAQVAQLTVPDADVLEINLKTKDDNDNEKTLNTMKFYPSLGFKVDFSGGMIYSTLFDESFEIINSTDEKTDTSFYVDEYFVTTDSITGITRSNYKQIKKVNSDEFTLGLGAFAHFYPRTGGTINFSFTAGTIIDNNVDMQYLFGASLILKSLQNKNRIVFTAGYSLGKVDRLRTEKYTLDTNIDPDLLQNISEDQLTVKKWESGYFIGLSWNFKTS